MKIQKTSDAQLNSNSQMIDSPKKRSASARHLGVFQKVIFLAVILSFFSSQNAFSGELLQLITQKEAAPADAGKSTTQLASPKADAGKSGSDLIGVGPEKKWQIHPGFKFQTTFDSNVNREAPHKRNEEIILSYIPSVTARRKGSKLDVAAGYEMSYQEFLRDADQSSFNHVANTDIVYKGDKLTTKIDERFAFVTAYATNEQSERRTVLANDFRPEIIYRLTPKVSVSSVYRHYLFSYRESAVRDNSYNLNEIGGRVYYHATPKLDFYVEGAGNLVDYYKSGIYDSRGYTILVGSVGKMTDKVVLNLQGGFRGQRYDDSSLNSFNGLVVEGILRYRLTRKFHVSILGKREKEESVYSNTAFYVSNKLGLEFDYRLTPRVHLNVDGSIARSHYPRETTSGTLTKKRRDYLFESGARINWYPFRYLNVSTGYAFRERESNFDNTFDYVDHVVDTSVSYQL